MLTITPTAAEAITSLVTNAEAPEGSGLRIATHSPEELVDHAGAPSLEVTLAAEPASADQVVELGGANVFVAPDCQEFLDGKLLDAQVEGDRVGFTLSDQAAGA